MLGHQVAPAEVIPTCKVCGKKHIYELVYNLAAYFKTTLFRPQIKSFSIKSIKVILNHVSASAPFFSGCGQKLVLQAWDMEGLRWRAQPGEGFPWTRHWTVLACTPPPHVTVHCRAQRNKALMMDAMNVMTHAQHVQCKVNVPETKEMSAILLEAGVEGGAEADRCDDTCSSGGLVG